MRERLPELIFFFRDLEPEHIQVHVAQKRFLLIKRNTYKAWSFKLSSMDMKSILPVKFGYFVIKLWSLDFA